MRVSYFYRENNFTEDSSYSSFIQFTSPLILNRNPTNQMHAAPKSYVDSIFSNNLDVTKISNGQISSFLFPLFEGDISNDGLSDSFNLKESGIPEGSYSKVIVDTKGLVVGTFDLEDSDIPMLNWLKLSPARPSSLFGYGITNGVSLTGGEMDGGLLYDGPTLDKENPLTRSSLVSLTNSLLKTKEPVGTIVERPVGTAIPNFLRCNGSLVDRVMYASLYVSIGDQYSLDPDLNPEQFAVPDLSLEEAAGRFFFIRY